MKSIKLSPIVHQLAQNKFNSIPGKPLIYWVSETVQALFINLPSLKDITEPKVGTQTGNNERFLRYWWEVGNKNIVFQTNSWQEASEANNTWFPYMKGGELKKWYGNQDYIVNWRNSAREIKSLFPSSVIRNPNFYFVEGITWSDLSGKGFGVRYLPKGFVFDVKGSSGFPKKEAILSTMAIMNSSWMSYSLGLLNPTVSFQVGDISRVPFKTPDESQKKVLEKYVAQAIQIRMREAKAIENTFEFILPLFWTTGVNDLGLLENKLASLEDHLDNEVFSLYTISNNDQEAIRSDLSQGSLEEDPIGESQDAPEEEITTSLTREELAARWVSYAIGIVLGRFHPGQPKMLGNAVFHREDFAKGSLPLPDAQEFDELVGSRDRAAYIDPSDDWHIFAQQVEQALCDLASTDGVAVLSENHPSDLAANVQKALELMLGEDGAIEVISTGAGGDLRKFLEKDYFTNYHLKWYRKRPVYWYIQSSKRSYGFVIFHEKVTKDTFYAIQREPYLDTKRNAVNLEMQDVQARIKQSAGGERKKLEKRLAELRDLADELAQFAKDLEEITRGGYEPEPDWIDDGVILRMAPLWKVIQLWKSEPKKYWDRLEAGDFDWSHIAMKYWPKRVREKCRKNKSFAIAHGHEEWYEGR